MLMLRHVTWLVIVSTVLGVAAGVSAQWPLGRDVPQIGVKPEDHATHVTSTGRFQVFVSPQAKGYTFMLDTDTGRIWILKKDHASGDFFMQRIRVEQVDSDEAAKTVTPKTQPDEPGSAKGK